MYTKGPWINDRGTIRTEDGQVIAECHIYDQATNRLGGAERDCNADLIATALELLEALQEAAAHLEYCGYGDSWEHECAISEGLPGKIETAIAKALKEHPA